MNTKYSSEELKKTMLFDSFPVLEYTVRYPKFTLEDKKAEKRINRYYEKLSSDFVEKNEKRLYSLACEEYKYKLRLYSAPPTFRAYLDFSVTRMDSVICVTTIQRLKLSDERPHILKNADIWSADGFPLKPRELADRPRRLYKALFEQYKKQSAIRGDKLSHPALKLNRVKRNIDDACLELNDSGIDLYLGYRELGGRPDESLAFNCPYGRLEGVLRSVFGATEA